MSLIYGYTETSDIQKALNLLRNNNYVIVSCGNGLFTTGGHYIVLVGIEENTLKIYDPYNYTGKFNVSSRRGKVEVSGNTIYCSIDNFKKYANYKGFFCYKNENKNVNNAIQNSRFTNGRVLVDIPIKIAFDNKGNKLIVYSNGYQFWIHRSVVKNSKVYGLADICFDGGQVDILQIFDEQFWCDEKYMSVASLPVVKLQNTVGQNRKLKQASIIYQNSNLTGSQFNYKANTTIKILQNITSEIDKIKVTSTGREGYIKNNNYK